MHISLINSLKTAHVLSCRSLKLTLNCGFSGYRWFYEHFKSLLTHSSLLVFVVSHTVHRSVVAVSVDPLVGQDLDVFPAGAAVQLVGSCQPAAHPVRQPALLGDMVLEIRRRLHRVLSDNRKHMSRNMK